MANVAHEQVSIIVPVFNDPAGVRDTLQSLLANTEPCVEIIVVDNDSTDNTKDVIQGFADRAENIAFLVEDDIRGSYAARNKGIKYASGEIIAFLDADITVDSSWLENAIDAMAEQGVEYLGCNVVLAYSDDTLVGRYNAKTGFPIKQYLEFENYAPTCALLADKGVFDDVGLFDDRLISGGDIEFGQRVAAAGYNQGYAADAIVTHPARTSFEALGKKNFRVGRGFCQKQRYYPERYGRPGIPPVPNGLRDDEEIDPESILTRLAFRLLSLLMLGCRGLGYYYEFLFGEG